MRIFDFLYSFSPSFAYVEFSDKDSVQTALALDDSLFKGRQIKVRRPKQSYFNRR